MLQRRKNTRIKLGNSAVFILCPCWSLPFTCYAINEVNLFKKWKIATAGLKRGADDVAGRTWILTTIRRLPQLLSFSPVSPVLVYLSLDLCPDILGWSLRREWLRIISQMPIHGHFWKQEASFLVPTIKEANDLSPTVLILWLLQNSLAEPVNDSRIVGAPAGIWTRVRDFLSLSSAERPLYMVLYKVWPDYTTGALKIGFLSRINIFSHV